MGLFQWLNIGQQGTQPNRSVTAAVPSARMGDGLDRAHGLDFASAIRLHRDLEGQLRRYLNDDLHESMDLRGLRRDDACVLGKWIHGSGGKSFAHLPSYAELLMAHRQFHQAAAMIVQLHDAERTLEALQVLMGGSYAHHSTQVMALLSSLYVEVADELLDQS